MEAESGPRLAVPKATTPTNPKGIASFSPGLRRRSYPGFESIEAHNPESGCVIPKLNTFTPSTVSLRLVDLLLTDGEITPMRLGGKMVQSYLPDVLQELSEKAKTSKPACTRKLQPPINTDGHG